MSKTPSEFRSTALGDDCEPIFGKLVLQANFAFFVLQERSIATEIKMIIIFKNFSIFGY
jgi:hypothetical protein